ncbi:hypothetical protein LZ32DRAFT_659439 [Colletotrichum eremochloae]|nr:hypothetical protein LZ32DRAFT_659439 [Colletotrichum eremochloae]
MNSTKAPAFSSSFGDWSQLETTTFYILNSEVNTYRNKSSIKFNANYLLVSGSTNAVSSVMAKVNSYASL